MHPCHRSVRALFIFPLFLAFVALVSSQCVNVITNDHPCINHRHPHGLTSRATIFRPQLHRHPRHRNQFVGFVSFKFMGVHPSFSAKNQTRRQLNTMYR
jgi:hypothetical protein